MAEGADESPKAEGQATGESKLKERLAAESRAALKAGEKIKLGALRLLAASVKNREVELRHPLTDEEFLEVATREVKRRKEAIEAYSAAGRGDLVAKETEEQQVLETYLPAALSETELIALVEEGVAATWAVGPGDFGKVMGYVMGKAKGRVDGKEVQARVRGRLAD
ncbi:MAG: GatB/YqeY domain-containing protein [Actinomycetota bacterium]